MVVCNRCGNKGRQNPTFAAGGWGCIFLIQPHGASQIKCCMIENNSDGIMIFLDRRIIELFY